MVPIGSIGLAPTSAPVLLAGKGKHCLLASLLHLAGHWPDSARIWTEQNARAASELNQKQLSSQYG